MPTVHYNGKVVSDENIKIILGRIAESLNGDVSITSGDRGSVPKGGSKTSHHLAHRAADFGVSGHTMASAYNAIRADAATIFDNDKRYQVIHHGVHTSTGGSHLHIGRYPSGIGVKYCTEGLTATTRGKYTCS